MDYFSASTSSWIPAKVVAVRPDGRYDLDCKTAVPPTKVRAATFSKPDFEVPLWALFLAIEGLKSPWRHLKR